MRLRRGPLEPRSEARVRENSPWNGTPSTAANVSTSARSFGRANTASTIAEWPAATARRALSTMVA